MKMMPSVYTFLKRSDNDILQELLRVLGTGRGSVKEKWSLAAECLVETGCDAIWKLSKDFCKKFELRFPCVAYVSITSVVFEDLSATLEVASVQHESMSLPEVVPDVPLIELWPTIEQREDYVNAATTASFIDVLRFFYSNIWMPWDDQDGSIVTPKTIEDRMGLWFDLHSGVINSRVARSIKLQRTSAIKAHEDLLELESLFSEDSDENDSMLPADNMLFRCAELNAKLESIKAQWSNLYENATVREQYLAQERNKWQKDKNKINCIAIWPGGQSDEFYDISNILQSHLTSSHSLTITTSAEDGLSRDPDEVIICCQECEIPEIQLLDISICSWKGVTLKASEMRAYLLMLGEKCRLKHLTLECGQVSTAVVMKAGTLEVTDCNIINSQRMDLTQGIVAKSGTKLTLNNCVLENFFSGIVVHRNAEIELNNCIIRNCGVGIQMYPECQVQLKDTVIESCREQCIRGESCPKDKNSIKGLHIGDNCKIGSGDLKKEILVVEAPEI
ncbi:protein nessun dorma [Pieris napi]|uniref:protein nessun dorma n=1 Tax=Pieris napi TaxID=78633 RepID=UPI001FB9CAB8|nr:protein nessun dorma [Pieris napi]